MKLIQDDEKGETYQADGCKILYRKKNSISGDNENNPKELILLVTGSAEVTVHDATWTVEDPDTIEFPAKTYHKIKALTDISFIVWDK